MVNDVSSEVAGLISGAKVFGSSENIRHGTYKFIIKRIFAQLVEIEDGKHKMVFCELTPYFSKANPQTEGDHVDYPGTAGPLKDDGNNPNAVGSNCALKVDFDGAGGRSAGSNIKAFVLALFNKRDGEVPDAEINKTWIDLSRQAPLKVGDAIGINPATNQAVLATEAKQANPACGMVIACTTMPKKKKTNDKGAYVTKLIWSCISPIGTGENASELIAKRRAEIEASSPIADDDEEEVTTPPSGIVAAPTGMVAPTNGYAPAPVAPPPPAPVAPPPPVVAAPFVPPAPWRVHPTAAPGTTPETRWFWNGAAAVVNETTLRAQLGL